MRTLLGLPKLAATLGALSPIALLALLVMLAAVGVAWSKKFLAVGSLVLGNVVVYLLTDLTPPQYGDAIRTALSFDSVNIAHNPPLALLQLFSSMFVHAGFLHLLGNMIVLLAFALPFEERVGARPFTIIYLASGLVAALTQYALLAALHEPVVLLGASGAVAGVIGAFAGSYPNLVIPLPLPLFVVMIFVRMRVWTAALVFAAVQLVSQAAATSGDNVAYGAHLGGLAFGLLLGVGLARSGRLGRRRPVSVDLGRLAPFAQDAGSKNALTHMASYQGEPQVFQAWLERFLRTATCPTCSHKVMPRHEGEMVCTQGHRFDVRAAPRAKAA
ncbi:MAG: rhomboid family intramembrane serine protease [Thermoplasmatota archaeon]